jgi:3-oxoacyl-[acyl-carrier-protein] synthase-3
MTAAVLCGLGTWVPPRVVTNDEIARRLGVTDEWIFQRTGVRRRHVCEPGMATSDLAVQAGARALRSAGLPAVGAVILSTATPDHQIPGTAPAVTARLGLGTAAALDINVVCSGFVYALALGSSLIHAGVADSVLVIGADSFSTVIDPDDKMVAPLFGDGAGAVVLRRGNAGERGALGAFSLGSDGRHCQFIMMPGGGSRQRSATGSPDPAQMYMNMDGRDTFMAAVRHMTAASLAAIERTGHTTADVDCFVGHQANIRILRAVAGQIGLPEQHIVSNLDRMGNTSAASIPLALSGGMADGLIKPGSVVLLTAFGAGLAWGSTVMTWPDIAVQDGDGGDT